MDGRDEVDGVVTNAMEERQDQNAVNIKYRCQ